MRVSRSYHSKAVAVRPFRSGDWRSTCCGAVDSAYRMRSPDHGSKTQA